MKENKTSKLLQDYRKQAYTKTRTDIVKWNLKLTSIQQNHDIQKWNHPIHFLLYMN